jgi:hypothetical protein
MPQIHDHDAAAAAVVLGASRASYLVMPRQNLWFIAFDGEEFGPYQSEREAVLFAVDAAQKLGKQGEPTRVFRRDEDGEASPVWAYGLDPYPPSL